MSFVSSVGISSPLGDDKKSTFSSLVSSTKGLFETELDVFGKFTVGLTKHQRPFLDNSEALLETASAQIAPVVSKAVAMYGPKRVLTLVGGTDNGSYNSFEAMKIKKHTGKFPGDFKLQKIAAYKSADFVKKLFKLEGISAGVSTACTSSANAILLANRLIGLGLYDAAVVGGVDIISHSVLLGFHSLEAVDRGACKPFSGDRSGINIGEAAGLLVLSRDCLSDDAIFIAGGGETSDAHHMTAPNPSGIEASRAMTLALAQAGLDPNDIDYINLHGTATSLNDAMEAQATHRIFADTVYASSTKALTGHTLGAAGAIELIFCYLLLSKLNSDFDIIPQAGEHNFDTKLPPLRFTPKGTRLTRLSYCMSNNFAFGGCNTSIIIGKHR